MRNRVRRRSAEAASWASAKLEALGDRVGMFEQDRALLGEPQTAGPTLEQGRAELALELGDLV